MKTMEGWTTIAWQDVTFAVPGDWEMLRYSSNHSRGSCALVDRWQERAQVIWNRPVSKINMERMVSDSRSREEEGGEVTCEKLEMPEGWWGYYAGSVGNAGGFTHAVKWFEEDQTLIEVHLTWPEESGREEAIERGVLEGVSVDTRSPVCHWCAFGIDVRLPRAVRLEECTIEPGSAKLRFEGKRGRFSWDIRRIGLPEVWLKQPLARWLERQALAEGGRAEWEDSPATAGAQAIHALCTRRRRKSPLCLLGAKTWRRDAAWMCEPTNRVFHVTLTACRRKYLEAAYIDLHCDCGKRLQQGKAA